MKIQYETKTCGRCGGSGEYSYNQINGTRCFGCGGSGKSLSVNGKKAKAAVEAFLLSNFGVAAELCVPGVQVRMSGLKGWGSPKSVVVETVSRASSNGVASPPYVTFGFVNSAGREWACSVFSGDVVQTRPTSEQFASLVVPFAKGFKGAVISE